MKRIFYAAFALLANSGFAQTNPTPHVLQSSDYSFAGYPNFTTTSYPASFGGWSGPFVMIDMDTNDPLAVSGPRLDQIPVTVQATADEPLGTGSSFCNCIGKITNLAHNGTEIRRVAPADPDGPLALVLSVDTRNTANDTLFWKASPHSYLAIGIVPKGNQYIRRTGLQLQYRVGTSGDWTNAPGQTAFRPVPGGITGVTESLFAFPLPAELLNQEVVQFRWLYFLYRYPVINTTVTDRDFDSMRLDDIILKATRTPAADFTYSSDSLTVNFADQSANNPTSWLWNFGDGNTSAQQHPQHIYNSPGTYTVKLYASNAAGTDSSVQTISSGGSRLIGANVLQESNVDIVRAWIYPNPCQGFFKLYLEGGEQNVFIRVTDILGKEIYVLKTSEREITIPVSDPGTALYFVHVHAGDYSKTLPVLIE